MGCYRSCARGPVESHELSSAAAVGRPRCLDEVAAAGPEESSGRVEYVSPTTCAEHVVSQNDPRREQLAKLPIRELKDLLCKLGGGAPYLLEKTELVDFVLRAAARPGSELDFAIDPREDDAPSVKHPLVAGTLHSEPRLGRVAEAPSAPDVRGEIPVDVVLEALAAGVHESETIVIQHCEVAASRALSHLAALWAELDPQVADAELHPSIGVAIQAHDTIRLIEAALERRRLGSSVGKRVQQLICETSIAEEAWLVRRSISEAVFRKDFAGIELWAELSKSSGEDVRVEHAYASMLRWSQKHGTPSGSAQDVGMHNAGDEAPDVGGDEGMQPLRDSSTGRSIDHSKNLAPGVVAAEFELNDTFFSCNGRLKTPYSATNGDLGQFARDDFKTCQQTPLQFSPNRELPPPASCASASSYTFSRGDIRKEHVGRAPLYTSFWNGPEQGQGQGTAYSFSSGNLPAEDAHIHREPRYSQFWESAQKCPRPEHVQSDKSQPPGPKMPQNAPPRPEHVQSDKHSPPGSTNPDNSVHVGPSAPSRPPPANHPASETDESRRAVAKGRAPPGHRVRLVDFLQAKACQPEGFVTGLGKAAVVNDGRCKFDPKPVPPPKAPAPRSPTVTQSSPPNFTQASSPTHKQPEHFASRSKEAPQSKRPWWVRDLRDMLSSDGKAAQKASGFVGSGRQGDTTSSASAQPKENDERTNYASEHASRQPRRSKDKSGPSEPNYRHQGSHRESKQPQGEEVPRESRQTQDERPPTAGRADRGKRDRDERSQARSQQRPAASSASDARARYLDLLGFVADDEPSADELKKAYRSMAMRWHPDRPHNRNRVQEATEKFQVAKDAYEYFMEEHRRRQT